MSHTTVIAKVPTSVPSVLDFAGNQGNTASSPLTAAMTNSQLTIPVSELQHFPDSGLVWIGTERIRYSSKSASSGAGNLVVTSGDRGFDGSTAQAHLQGELVILAISAYFFNRTIAEVRALAQTVAGTVVNVAQYGGAGDAVRHGSGGSITSGMTALTVTGAAFTSSDVGKLITVAGAGAAGATLVTTIAGYTSATQVTLAAQASTTVANQEVIYGTDNTTPFVNAIAALPSGTTQGQSGGTVVFGPGRWMHRGITLAYGQRLRGAGIYTSQLDYAGTTSGHGIDVSGSYLAVPATDPDGWALADFLHNAIVATTGWAVNSPTGGNREIRIERISVGGGFTNGIRIWYFVDVSIDQVRLNGRGWGVAGAVGLSLKDNAGGVSSNIATVTSCYVNNYETGMDLKVGYITLVTPGYESNFIGCRWESTGIVINPWIGGGTERTVTDGVATAGSSTFTSATANFGANNTGPNTGSDQYATINIAGAGPGGSILATRITSVVNATTVTLEAPARTTVAAASTKIYRGASGVSGQSIDWDCITPIHLVGYSSSRVLFRYASTTTKQRSIVQPERNDRAPTDMHLGQIPGIKLGSWRFEADPGNAYLEAIDAESGSTLENAPDLVLRGSYWNGTYAINRDAVIRHSLTAVTPASQLDFLIGGSTRGTLTDGGDWRVNRVNGNGSVLGIGGPHYSRYLVAIGGAGDTAFTSDASGTTDTAALLVRPASIANASGTGALSIVNIGSASLNPAGATAIGAAVRINVPTKGGAGTITDFATVYIDGAPTGGTNNYATYIGSGANYVGGTLTLAPMTPGSVLFAGAGGLVSQDNTGLFYDSVDDQLGIGTATPDLSGFGSTAGLSIRGGANGGGLPVFIELESTRPIADGVSLADIRARQGNNATASRRTVAQLLMASEGASPTDVGGRISLSTRPNASDQFVEGFRLDSNGTILIGHTQSGGTNRGDIVLRGGAANGWIRSQNAANTTTIGLIHLDGSDRIVINDTASEVWVGAGVLDVRTGGLAFNGTVLFENDRDFVQHLIPGADNTYDVGSTTRNPRALYIKRTQGSVLFMGASGLITEDNTAFFYDATNDQLGIGTTDPDLSGFNRAGITIHGTSGEGFVELVTTRTDADAAALGRLRPYYDTNAAGHKTVADVAFLSDGTTVNQRGGRIVFRTKADASTTLADRLIIAQDGSVDVNTGTFKVGGTIVQENDRDFAIHLIANASGSLDLGSTSRFWRVGYMQAINSDGTFLGIAGPRNGRYLAALGGVGDTAFVSTENGVNDVAALIVRPASIANTAGGTGDFAVVLVSGGTSLNPVGASSIGAGLRVGAPAKGGVGTFATMAALYVDGAPTGGTNNYALYVGGGTAISLLEGNLQFKSGTSFFGTLDHAITANRTWTYPDIAGTLIVDAGSQTLSGQKTFTGGLVITTADLTITDRDVVLSATTGTKLGTGSTQKLGFWGATPIAQGASIADPAANGTPDAPLTYTEAAMQTELDKLKTNDDNLRTSIISIISRLEAAGFIATV